MSKEEISNRLRDIGNGLHGLAQDADHILSELAAVKAERDGLNRDQTQLANQPTVPRVIDREELKNGQWVAVCGEGGSWHAIQVQSNANEAWLIEDSIGAYPSDTLVLLEDAPAEEPEPVKVGDELPVEHLAALPNDTILRDVHGQAWEKDRNVWHGTSQGLVMSPGKDLARNAPLTVLYLPEEDA